MAIKITDPKKALEFFYMLGSMHRMEQERKVKEALEEVTANFNEAHELDSKMTQSEHFEMARKCKLDKEYARYIKHGEPNEEGKFEGYHAFYVYWNIYRQHVKRYGDNPERLPKDIKEAFIDIKKQLGVSKERELRKELKLVNKIQGLDKIKID